MSALTLLGYQAIEEERIITFPDEFKLDYLNHKKYSDMKDTIITSKRKQLELKTLFSLLLLL